MYRGDVCIRKSFSLHSMSVLYKGVLELTDVNRPPAAVDTGDHAN